MDQLWDNILGTIDRMGIQEWTLVLISAIVIGFYCLRGFGSRSNY